MAASDNCNRPYLNKKPAAKRRVFSQGNFFSLGFSAATQIKASDQRHCSRKPRRRFGDYLKTICKKVAVAALAIAAIEIEETHLIYPGTWTPSKVPVKL